jgi:hypothetical protein
MATIIIEPENLLRMMISFALQCVAASVDGWFLRGNSSSSEIRLVRRRDLGVRSRIPFAVLRADKFHPFVQGIRVLRRRRGCSGSCLRPDGGVPARPSPAGASLTTTNGRDNPGRRPAHRRSARRRAATPGRRYLSWRRRSARCRQGQAAGRARRACRLDGRRVQNPSVSWLACLGARLGRLAHSVRKVLNGRVEGAGRMPHFGKLVGNPTPPA